MADKTIPLNWLHVPENTDTRILEAVLRALGWCNDLLEGTLWTTHTVNGECTLQRTINEHLVTLYPMEAASMDLGMETRYSPGHLPIEVNNTSVCVRSRPSHEPPLHTDMVASVILLLADDDVDPAAIPKTLHAILTDEQRAALPPQRSQRARTVPGQPSTSGREFLPEARILALIEQHPNATFSVQFERRDGTLRNMIARRNDDFCAREEEGNGEVSTATFGYNPADYHLASVIDVPLGEYRMLATDRVTEMTIGGETMRTDSAE